MMIDPWAGRVAGVRSTPRAPRVHPHLARLLAALLAAAVPLCSTWALDMLAPGSDARACDSMLTPGVRQACVESRSTMSLESAPRSPTSAVLDGARAAAPPARVDQATAPSPSASAAGSSPSSSMEAAIDEYLASFGKPPRAAVRALLDPSDENVAALLAEQRRQESRAAQVAARLTRLRQHETP